MKGWGDFINRWLIGDKEYFNTTLEEYSYILDGTFDYITKNDFDSVHDILLLVHF